MARIDVMSVPSAVSLLAVMIFLAWPFACTAGGILHVFAPEVDGKAYAVARPTVLLSRTLVTASESATEYRIDQTFYNNDEFPLKGIYLLPLGKMDLYAHPEVSVDMVTTPYELLSPEEFLPTLKELTLSMHDPSLLGLAGQKVLVVRSVSIGARNQKSFRVEFTSGSVLEKDLLDIHLPLDGERYALAPVGEFEVRVRLKLSSPIRAVFSPTHHLSIFKEAAHRCLATVERKTEKVRNDFRLLAFLSGEDLDIRVLTHRSGGRNGAFLTLLLPPTVSTKTRELDRDVVFLLDTSGSMGAQYFEMAKSSLTFCLERLRSGDRFNVLIMGTRIGRMVERLVPANDDNVKQAVGFVNSAETGGGTDLYNGLVMALEQFPSRRRPCIVIVAGDGRGTVGIIDPTAIIEDVRRSNRAQARIFVLALGKHSDAVLLDKLASATRGSCIHATANQGFESIMNRFLTAISPPTASELDLSFEGVLTEHVMPEPVPDMFGQESIMVLGHYSQTGEATSKVKLRAKIRGSVRTVTRLCTFPEVDLSHPYVPALWAMRRLALLLERERLKGLDEQAKVEITQLSSDFGFRIPVSGRPDHVLKGAKGLRRDSGELLWALKTSQVPADVESHQCRHINGKAFRKEDGVWIDTLYRHLMQTVQIDFLGPEYFSLLQQNPELGPYLALGPQVTFVHGKSAIAVRQVSEEPIK